MAQFRIGDIITFRYPLPPNTRAHVPYPTVFVLHSNWQGLLHGLLWDVATQDEINTIRMLIDPFFEMKYKEALRRKNPNIYKELENIITTPQKWGQVSVRNAKIDSPQSFYHGVIKPFIQPRGYSLYRKYRIEKISGGRVKTPARIITGEESISKWQKERQELAKAVKKALGEAKTPEQTKVVKEMQDKLDHATAMSQRKSLLTIFAEFVQYWRGPRGPKFNIFGR